MKFFLPGVFLIFVSLFIAIPIKAAEPTPGDEVQSTDAVVAPGWRGTVIRSEVMGRATLPDELNPTPTPTLAPGAPTPTIIPPVIGVNKSFIHSVPQKVVCTLFGLIPGVRDFFFGANYCPQLLILSQDTQRFVHTTQNIINSQRPQEITPTLPRSDSDLTDPSDRKAGNQMISDISSSLGTDQGLNSLNMPQELLEEITCNEAKDLVKKYNLTEDLAKLILGSKSFDKDCRVADEKTREKLFDQANFPEGINPFEPSITP